MTVSPVNFTMKPEQELAGRPEIPGCNLVSMCSTGRGQGAAETPEGAAETLWSLNVSAVIGACIGLCSPLAVLGQVI